MDGIDGMAEILWDDENDALAVTLYADASATLIDKASGERWRMGPVALQEEGPIDVGHVWLRTARSICEQYPARFRARRAGDVVRVTLLGRERRPRGQFSYRLRLDGPWLDVSIFDIDAALPSLVFPPPLVTESLVLPMGVGRWVREPLPDRRLWVYPAHLNMRWFGGLRGDHGWLAVIADGAPDAGVLAAELSAAPAWLQSLGRWEGTRRLRYRFTRGGYVGLARAYRDYAREHGLHRPLSEKMEATPALRALHGGRILSFMQAASMRRERFEDRLQPVPPGVPPRGGNPRVYATHARVRATIDEARRLGMRRGLAVVRGWGAGGYDESHPDVWPPDPALGALDELRGLTALDGPVTAALHDNYQDIYEQSPSWPRGVIRSRSGEPLPGGVWAGGQAYILNARDGLAYARRNWPRIATLGPRAMFIDTTTAVQLYESYEPGNELTRAQDLALKVELLRFYKERGQVLGSEEGADFGVPWVDWSENRHRRVAGASIPLWPLVYHDAVFNARYGPGPCAPESDASPAPRWLADMLWGYPLLWGIREPAAWRGERAAFASTLVVDRWHARIGADDLTSHRYLTEDGEVEETVFSSGVALAANFAAEARTVAGVTIPAGGYVIRADA